MNICICVQVSNGDLAEAVAFITEKNAKVPQQDEATYYQTAQIPNDRYISVGSQADTSTYLNLRTMIGRNPGKVTLFCDAVQSNAMTQMEAEWRTSCKCSVPDSKNDFSTLDFNLCLNLMSGILGLIH